MKRAFWILSMFVAGGCGPAWVPPCEVSASTTALAAELGFAGPSSGPVGAPRLERLTPKRLQVTWWRSAPPSSADAGTPIAGPTAEVALLAAEGSVLERHSVPTTAASSLDAARLSAQRFFWTGAGMVTLRSHDQTFDDAGGTQHTRRTVRLERSSDSGALSATDLAVTECTDCDLAFVAHWLKGRLVILYSHLPPGSGAMSGVGLSGVMGPPMPSETRFVTTTADGTVVSSGTLEWLPNFLPTVRFVGDEPTARAELLVLGTPDGFWLVDETLTRRAGPFGRPFSTVMRVDWSDDLSKVVVAWVEAPRSDLLLQVFEQTGKAATEPQRVSRTNQIEAVGFSERRLGVTFFDDGPREVFSAALAGAQKIGGDVPLWQAPDAGTQAGPVSTAFPQGGLLLPDDDGFTHAAFRGGVVLSRVTCQP